MKKLVVSGKEVLNALLKIGFVFVRSKGSHTRLTRELSGRVFNVTVPIHGNKEINPTVLRSIIRQSGLTPDEFEKLFD